MSAVALVGSVTALLKPATLDRLLLPFISLAAGTLLGGAFFHMIPEGAIALSPLSSAVWLVMGFTVFLGLEQFLQWHQSHRVSAQVRQPVTYLILIGDGIHNFLGGLSIASTFLINPSAGVIAWIAAAAHEVPQELGDFGILVHGGFERRRALLWNLASALTFPIGAILAYLVSQRIDVSGLVLFGAGTFIYIAASDLVPEIKAHKRLGDALVHFGCFVFGLALTLWLALVP
ncbi:ZIP family metal transporter [Billgrantia diversa]|uniref:ZIP family metal transporter n=1 Tax=Halomonas sp. MCCC 1A13316 TaxID=2733487 RepID=UPI0018A6A5BB|nr:ZIP family metal transporter [Halomonas sp. MCCC 1A13316]QOR38080.1 ZIP family metal transporter [Halomonas sp. MCCC 1A13316]